MQRQYLEQKLLVTLREKNFPACVEVSVQEMSSLMQWRFKYPLKVEARVQLVDEAIVEAFNKVSLSSLVLVQPAFSETQEVGFASSEGQLVLRLETGEQQVGLRVELEGAAVFAQTYRTERFQMCQELVLLPGEESHIRLQSYLMLLFRTHSQGFSLEVFYVRTLEEEFHHLATFSRPLPFPATAPPSPQALLDAFFSLLSPQDKEFYLKQLLLYPLEADRQLEFSQQEMVQILQKYAHRNRSFD